MQFAPTVRRFPGLNTLRAWHCAAWLALASCGAPAQILIGQTAGFSGPASASVKEMTDGAHLYLDAVNARGGLYRQPIELISLDDRFDPALAAQNARELIERRQVVALFLNHGTPHTEAVIPVLDQYGVALVAPSAGAMVLHQPVRRHVFNVRTPYQREAEKTISHLISMGMTRIALIHVNDSFGTDGLAGALKGLEAAQLMPVIKASYERNRPDFLTIALQVARADAQAVLMIGPGATVLDGLRALRAAGSNAQLATLSNNASLGFAKSLGEQGRGVIVSQVFPYERGISHPLVKEAQELARARGLNEISPAMVEGFAAARVLVEALRRAGPRPTRERVQAALENLRKFDIGGFQINYSPEDHSGLDFTDLSIIGSDGRFKR